MYGRGDHHEDDNDAHHYDDDAMERIIPRKYSLIFLLCEENMASG